MLLFLLACSRIEVSESWQIDRLRVLAIAAEPAEPRPGDTVRFQSLVVSPNRPVECVAWIGCSAEEGFGCGLEGLAGDSGAAGLASSLLGLEPFSPPVWQVPADYLDNLPEADRAEGIPAIITTIAITDCSALQEASAETANDLLNGDVDSSEIGFKRVPVSLAETPNHNPTVVGITVDGIAVAPGVRLELDRKQTYDLAVSLNDDAVESYQYLNQSGQAEERIEEPYFSWYSQEGSFNQTNTLWDVVTVEYTTPELPEQLEQSLWVVARDRRGGMGWAELPIRIR